MKWFGRKSAAGSARAPLTRGWASGAPLGEWPANYEAQVRTGMLANPVAQRSVRLVCEAAGSASLSASGVEPEAGARAVALVRARSAGQPLIETLAMHLLLHGNGYVQILLGADGTPVELIAQIGRAHV